MQTLRHIGSIAKPSDVIIGSPRIPKRNANKAGT